MYQICSIIYCSNEPTLITRPNITFCSMKPKYCVSKIFFCFFFFCKVLTPFILISPQLQGTSAVVLMFSRLPFYLVFFVVVVIYLCSDIPNDFSKLDYLCMHSKQKAEFRQLFKHTVNIKCSVFPQCKAALFEMEAYSGFSGIAWLCVKGFVLNETLVFWKALYVVIVKWHADTNRVKNAVYLFKQKISHGCYHLLWSFFIAVSLFLKEVLLSLLLNFLKPIGIGFLSKYKLSVQLFMKQSHGGFMYQNR